MALCMLNWRLVFWGYFKHVRTNMISLSWSSQNYDLSWKMFWKFRLQLVTSSSRFLSKYNILKINYPADSCQLTFTLINSNFCREVFKKIKLHSPCSKLTCSNILTAVQNKIVQASQQLFTCSKLTVETLEKCDEYLQS